MKNFVVYSNMEYNLGNSLNLIIGPNGTGKSTLIAALCLGLGGKPEHLGARKLEDYIKTGCQSATVEIEVKAPSHEAQNYVISRTIQFKSNKWTLNGASISQAKIMAYIKKLRIQVDNLCQFLPQERVADFAELNAQQRLRSTELAIGDIDLLENHDKLINLSKQLDTYTRSKEEDEERLMQLRGTLEEKNKQVDAITAYATLKNEYETLNATLPFCELNELSVRRAELKESLTLCRQQIELAKARNEGIRPRLETSKIILEENEKDAKLNENEMEVLKITSDKSYELIDQLQKQLVYAKGKIPGVVQKGKSYEEDLKNQKINLKKLEEAKIRLEELNNDEELETLNTQLRELRTARTENRGIVKEKTNAIQEKSRNEKYPLENNIKNCNNRIRDLLDLQKQKISFVEKLSYGDGVAIIDALRHYETIKSQFKAKVHAPPLFSLTMKDAACIPIFSSNVSQRTMSTFVCENREDYLLFSNEIVDRLGLNVNVIEYSGTKARTLTDHVQPIERESLIRNGGFDGYLIDVVDAHPAVLNMLCHQEKIHAIPYTKRKRITPAMEEFLNDKGFLGRCSDLYTITTYSKSNYGQRLLSSNSRKLSQPYWSGIFNNSGSSAQQRTELENKKRDYEMQLEQIVEGIHSLKEELDELEEEGKRLTDEDTELRNKKTEIEDSSRKLGRLNSSIEQLKDRIEQKESNPPDVRQQVKLLEAEIEKVSSQLYNESGKLSALLEKGMNLTKKSVELEIQRTVATHEANTYDKILKTGHEDLLERERNIKREGSAIVDQVKQLKSQLTKIKEPRRSELYTKSEEFPTKGDLTVAIESIKARMELDSGSHMRYNIDEIIKGRDDLVAQVEELEATIEKSEKILTKLDTDIEEVASKWKPEVTRLVGRVSSKFSEMFAKIGCEGKVCLNSDSKLYEEWSLDIFVSFRENSQMQILNARRQSGGERSVATSLYLMALQGMSKAPFRVVDEINQGMDPRNERMVHDLMVKIACSENTSQYFLVTPKLLRDLPYHKRMKVCCIYSGEKISEDAVKRLAVSDVIKRMYELKAGGE